MGNISDLIARRRAEYLQAAGVFRSVVCNQCRVGRGRLQSWYHVAGRYPGRLLCAECLGNSQMDIGKTEQTMKWGERAGWVILGMWVEIVIFAIFGLIG